MPPEQPSARIPQPGDTLAGKYRIARVLGVGGMGVVLEAEHVRLRQPVAIKVLNPSMVDVPEIRQRFEREARAAATLKSPHVARVMDVEITPDGIPYMVMELLLGRDLEAEREARKALPYAEVVDYVLQACGALAEAHAAGIIHRDLKPGNLFLSRQAEDDRLIVKVLDFGISKVLTEDTKLTSAGAVIGTALYMSPEQVRGRAIDARSDVWSLGVILYELISGEAPWVGSPPRVAACIVSEAPPSLHERAPGVPLPLVHTIERMLEKDVSRRVAGIAEVAASLAPFASPGSLGSAVAGQLERRSARGSTSARSLPAPTDSDPAVVVAKTLHDERSTTSAQTMSSDRVRRSRTVVGFALGTSVALGIVGVVAIVLSLRAPRQDAATTITESPVRAPAESSPPIVPPEPPAPAPTASHASVEAPPPSAEPQPVATAAATVRKKPAVPVRTPTATSATKPTQKPPSDATVNPQFLN